MRKQFFVLSLTLITLSSYCQTNLVAGKWKIFAVNAGIYHNYKNDSTAVPKEITESLRGNKDSAFSLGFVKEMVKDFADYYMIFQDNYQFKEIRKGKVLQSGTYTVNKAKSQIIQLMDKGNGTEIKQTLNYRITGNTIEITFPSKDMAMVLWMEKQN
jgi:hypothetical protein